MKTFFKSTKFWFLLKNKNLSKAISLFAHKNNIAVEIHTRLGKPYGIKIFISESIPEVANEGIVGWVSTQLTGPVTSPISHWTIDSFSLSQKNMLPQSLPLTINSDRGPKKFIPFIVDRFLR